MTLVVEWCATQLEKAILGGSFSRVSAQFGRGGERPLSPDGCAFGFVGSEPCSSMQKSTPHPARVVTIEPASTTAAQHQKHIPVS